MNQALELMNRCALRVTQSYPELPRATQSYSELPEKKRGTDRQTNRRTGGRTSYRDPRTHLKSCSKSNFALYVCSNYDLFSQWLWCFITLANIKWALFSTDIQQKSCSKFSNGAVVVGWHCSMATTSTSLSPM